MTDRFKFVMLLIFCFIIFVSKGQDNNMSLAWVKHVGAHIFSFPDKVFNVTDYGAVPDGRILSSPGIQKAIDACSAAGGGTVVFAAGVYLSGSIFLKNNVHLQIDKDVTLLGSQNFDDYPEINTRIAGIEMKWPAALINVIGQKNVTIDGNGKINANGKFCWDKYWNMRKQYDAKGLRWVVDYDAKRVRTVLVQNASDVVLQGLTIMNAGFWTVQILYSSHITANALVIRNNEQGKGPSTDGIDIDSSAWVLVENCDVDCNDDDYCLKAGRDWDGLRVNRPTQYVVLRNCIARRGGGTLTIGSETSGSIQHVLAMDMHGIGTGNALHIKSAYTRGGVVEDIHFENADLDGVKNVFHFVTNWNPSYSYSKLPDGYDSTNVPQYWLKLLRKPQPAEKGIPVFRDIYIRNVKAIHAGTAIDAAGMPDGKSYLSGFHFDHIVIDAAKAGEIDGAKDWTIRNWSLIAQDASLIDIKNSQNISFK